MLFRLFLFDDCCSEMPVPSVPSRVSKLVERYSEIGKTLTSPFDDVTSSSHTAGSRGQSPVQEVIETEHEG